MVRYQRGPAAILYLTITTGAGLTGGTSRSTVLLSGGLPMSTDPHGQPLNVRFNRARRAERDLSEMLGLLKGVLADGEVTRTEAALLRDWVLQHRDATEQWPVNILKDRLERIFADGKV